MEDKYRRIKKWISDAGFEIDRITDNKWYEVIFYVKHPNGARGTIVRTNESYTRWELSFRDSSDNYYEVTGRPQLLVKKLLLVLGPGCAKSWSSLVSWGIRVNNRLISGRY